MAGDPGQLGGLAGGEVLGVLPQRTPGLLRGPHLTGAKGGKHRTVPLPRSTVRNVDVYLAERAASGDDRLKPVLRAPLFVRHNGTALNQQFVDSLLRRLAAVGGVAAPEGAMAHALRHSYGMELALRGVPLPVIQQLLGHSDPRTTSICIAAHASDLTSTLDDAGLVQHCLDDPAERKRDRW